MSRKKNRRWNSMRSTGPVDATLLAHLKAALEQQLNEEMQRQVAANPRGNMAGVRLTIKTPARDLVLEFPEEET